jgi:diguanylate cyclase (GGDEF)-like protein
MKRVLAFEGDTEFAERLQLHLGRHGCIVDIALDVDSALQRIEQKPPHLILLSIELPGTDGFSVCNRLKKDARFRDIPLIVWSSECTETTFAAHRAMRTHAEDYLIKPFEFSELIDKVDQLIGLDVPPDGPLQRRSDSDGLDLEEYLGGPAGLSELTELVDALDRHYDELHQEEDRESRIPHHSTIIPRGSGSWLPERSSPGSSQPPALDRPSGFVPFSADHLTPPPLEVMAEELAEELAWEQETVIVLQSPQRQLRGKRMVLPSFFGLPPEEKSGPPTVSVGRALENDWVFEDAQVSERHCLLEQVHGDIFVTDLESHNGTFVNDRPVSRHELRGGELIRLGDTVLLFLARMSLEEQFVRLTRKLLDTDAQTWISTRQAFRSRLEQEVAAAARENRPLSLLSVYVDNMWRVTLEHGDVSADHVVTETARIIVKKIPLGIVGRNMGVGFLVALPGATEKTAAAMAEGLRFEAAVSEIRCEGRSISPLLSVGLMPWQPGCSVTELISQANRLLLEARRLGGNRVASPNRH